MIEFQRWLKWKRRLRSRPERRCLRALWALFCVLAPVAWADGTGPALRHGVNLSNWFTGFERQPISDSDFQRIKAAGFDHVRIPVNPELFGFSLGEGEGGRVLFDFTRLDAGIDAARAQHLSVILDIHPSDGFMTVMELDPKAAIALAGLWRRLAEHYQDAVADVAFEILNEPSYKDDTAPYAALVGEVLSAIREVTPKATVIADAPKNASLDGLDGLKPIADDNLYYAFHFYEPLIVTHQGLKLSGEGRSLRYFHNIPYPSWLADANIAYAPSAADSIEAKKEVADYIAGKWDDAHIAARVKLASDWAAANHSRVICTEFGVARGAISPAARYQWIADVRKTLNAQEIGWDVWDYSDLFGIVTLTGPTVTERSDGLVRLADPNEGARNIEPEAIRALFAR